MRRAILLLLLSAAGAWAQSNTLGDMVEFGNPVFSAITTAQASAPIQNKSQGSHLIEVLFPTAVADVSPIQVRMEAAYICPDPPLCAAALWFPIGPDITTAPLLLGGTLAYSLQRANGVFPLLRVRSLLATPGALPMTVNYTGAPFPIANVFLSGDRWLIGGPSSGYDKATFVVCNGSPCVVASDVTNHYIAVDSLTFRVCYIFAKTAPTGADLIVDLKIADTGASIFPAGNANKLVFPAGGTTVQSVTTFATASIEQVQRLRADILQVGTGTAGQDVTVSCVLDF